MKYLWLGMVIPETHLLDVSCLVASWQVFAAAYFILGAKLRRRLLDAPHQQPLWWPRGCICSGRPWTKQLSLSEVFLLAECLWKGTENLVSMENQAWTALLHLYLLSLHFFCIPLQPSLKQPEQIWLCPPGGTVKLLLAEDLLVPSQTHPVIPFGWGLRKLSTLGY